MISNNSFGGSNRGPESERRKVRPTRSNVFVDIATVALLLACGGAVAYQYMPLFSTSGYQVASGQLERAGLSYSGYSSYNRSYGRYSSYRRGGWVNMLEAEYTFTANGRQYHSRVTSLPVLTFTAFDLMSMANSSAGSNLAVRYDPANPDNNVAASVIENFGKSVLVSYIALFFVGLVLLTLSGMSNLSGEVWRPQRGNNFY